MSVIQVAGSLSQNRFLVEFVKQSRVSAPLIPHHNGSIMKSNMMDRVTAAIIIQKIIRGKLARKRIQNLGMKYFVAKELFLTEINYVDVICRIVKSVMIPLHENEHKIRLRTWSVAESFCSDIFRHFEELLAFHLSFISSIFKYIEKWTAYSDIANVFNQKVCKISQMKQSNDFSIARDFEDLYISSTEKTMKS